jgi:large subunit ribosomal protein L25
MDQLTLSATTGRSLGSRSSRRLRADGQVPAVVYGHGGEAVPIVVDWSSLRRALSTDAGVNALITLDVDGDEQLSIVKELQRDPVRRSVTHVDFIRIDRDTEIEVEVPVIVEGHAEAVEQNDGTVAHLLFSLPIKSKPDSIPTDLRFDVSHMEIGDSVRVEDLQLPEGVSTEIDPDEVVATAMITRSTLEVAAEEELAAELAELAEAEGEGEGLEGAEDAEGTDSADGDDPGGDDEG